MLAMGRPRGLVEHMLELAALLREPKAPEVTDTGGRLVARLLGTGRSSSHFQDP